MKIHIYIICAISLLSCRKQTGINIPKVEPGLVVTSNLCADTLISFQLSYTQAITDNSPAVKELGATIILYNQDSVFLDLFTNKGNGNYISAVTAAASQKYVVQIIINNKTYWTSDSVPKKAEGAITSVDSSNFHNNPHFFQIHYSLSDKQIYQNYYGFKMKHYYEEYQSNDTFLREEWLDIETIDAILIEDINSKFIKTHLLFTDKYFNNNTINLAFGTSKIIHTNNFKTKYLIVFTEQYSFKAFAYLSSINEHIFYQSDPFSQPVGVKGNVDNAYGAFIGRNIKADTLHFKY